MAPSVTALWGSIPREGAASKSPMAVSRKWKRGLTWDWNTCVLAPWFSCAKWLMLKAPPPSRLEAKVAQRKKETEGRDRLLDCATTTLRRHLGLGRLRSERPMGTFAGARS